LKKLNNCWTRVTSVLATAVSTAGLKTIHSTGDKQ